MSNAGWTDDKIVIIRRMLKEGATLDAMAEAVGYKSGSSVRSYIKKMGLPLPSVNGRRHGVSHSEARRKALSERMKQWHRDHNHHAEKGNKPL